ncbi:hypothetical protein TCON_0818 [Astathelohania contejeani]|uniref:Uncharacterized protein n=1 Tax=Astathelohania contejeani TaxID=164912 RepID=A0ABQ7I0Q1_9MICR|nr:hypothetical protein TCON_0818 [Thelohania contejeani]
MSFLFMIYIFYIFEFVKMVPTLLGDLGIISLANNKRLHLTFMDKVPFVLKRHDFGDKRDMVKFIGVDNNFILYFKNSALCVDPKNKTRLTSCRLKVAEKYGLWSIKIAPNGIIFIHKNGLCLTVGKPSKKLSTAFIAELNQCSDISLTSQLFDIKLIIENSVENPIFNKRIKRKYGLLQQDYFSGWNNNHIW